MKIIVPDFKGRRAAIAYTPIEFFAVRTQADADGITVEELMEAAELDLLAARRIVDFPPK